ncbi:MliC family protein [Pelagibacterium sp. 26DY04]|uniref:MliC family protein n=1 Tax=Pelagibacterium sp. 26DY04 TaxID=2967130 RepID=UPI0028165459|nr:MliC family protein [Pelagibacterium sp. 26DY04]WMT87223.1 MliC family protein [Pelagibacterium sp. 26DY04]
MKSLVVAAALSLAALPALAVETSMQLVLELEGNAQRDVTTYQCDGIEEPMVVEYINAHPIFLAMVPVEGENLIFVNVISGSGARYVSGQYEWWTRGNEAFFSDAMTAEGESEAEPVTCHSIEEIP